MELPICREKGSKNMEQCRINLFTPSWAGSPSGKKEKKHKDKEKESKATAGTAHKLGKRGQEVVGKNGRLLNISNAFR